MTHHTTAHRTGRSRRRLGLLTATAAGLLASVAATTGAEANTAAAPPDDCEANEGRLTIATGNSTGVYYVFGGGIASVLSDQTAIQATASETGASVQNIEQVVAGDYQIAFSLADSASDAIAGRDSFSEPQPIQALGRVHSNYTQVVVRNDAGIATVADMAGKTISTGSPKSGTEVIATRLLETAGLDIDADVSAQRLDLTQTVDGMKDGSLDGFVWSGGLPTAALTDLFATHGDDISFLDVTPQLSAMQAINEVYAEGVIPADTYGTDADIPTIVVPNVLIVRDDFADNDACAVTWTIWSNVDALAQVHPAAADLDPTTALDTGPIPIAPGAERALVALGGELPSSEAAAGSSASPASTAVATTG